MEFGGSLARELPSVRSVLIPVRAIAPVAAVIAIVSSLTTGCAHSGTADPVSPADLQAGLAARTAQTGTVATWVSCPNSLAAQVGATTRCDVTLKDRNSVTALLTTTQVEDGKAVWEITEAQLSKDQVAKRVSAAMGVKDVKCDSGMTARVGNWVPCHIKKYGTTVQQTAEVTAVKGLAVTLTVVEFMPLQQVEEAVKGRLIPLYGRAPDQIRCKEDLPGIPGRTVGCRTTIDGRVDDWVVTVTGVSQGNIDFDVARSAQSRGGGG